MPDKSGPPSDLERLVESVATQAGYELVDVEFHREPSGWVLRAYIDHPEGATVPIVTVDDCAKVSALLGAALDEADLITHEYSLEVSSPGLDRPLRTDRHFVRFVGHRARIRLNKGIAGGPEGNPRRNFTGVITGADPANVRIRLDDGVETTLPLADLAKANLVPEL
jgi:ribosome maturation factor RimP